MYVRRCCGIFSIHFVFNHVSIKLGGIAYNLLLSYGFFLLSDNLLLLPHTWSDFDQLGQQHVWGDSYKSLTRIGGPGSPGTSGVKNVKQCSMTTKLGQRNQWCKLKMMMTFTEVKGYQRSNVVNNMLWLPNLVRSKNPWCKFLIMKTFIEVKGHQRSNVVNYA